MRWELVCRLIGELPWPGRWEVRIQMMGERMPRGSRRGLSQRVPMIGEALNHLVFARAAKGEAGVGGARTGRLLVSYQ
jgi:hypothetical protein